MRSRQIGSFSTEGIWGKNKNSLKRAASISYFQLSPFPPHSHHPGFLSRFSIVIPTVPECFWGLTLTHPQSSGFLLPQCNQTPPGLQIQVQPCSYTIVVKQRGHRGQVPWFVGSWKSSHRTGISRLERWQPEFRDLLKTPVIYRKNPIKK